MSFESSSPGVDVAQTGQRQRMELPTTYLNDEFVPQCWQNLGRLEEGSPAMPQGTVFPVSVREYLTLVVQKEHSSFSTQNVFYLPFFIERLENLLWSLRLIVLV